MLTMRLPFLYRAEIVKPRKRIPETVTVADHADFAVPHVSSAEAPVAVTWVSHSRHRFDPVAARDDPRPVRGTPAPPAVHRTWEGRSYLPMRDDGGPGIDADAFEASLASPATREAHALDWSTSRYPRQRGLFGAGSSVAACGCFGTTLAGHFGPVGNGRVRTDTRDASLHGARAAFAGSLLVVDGTVWSAVDVVEPHWVVSDDGHGGIGVGVGDGACPSWHQAAFAADRRGDAVGWARRLAAAAGLPPSRVRVAGDALDVADPALLTFDDGLATGRQLLSWNSRITGVFPQAAPDDVAAMRDEAVALAKGIHDGGLAWASHALGFFGDLRAAMRGHGLWDGDAAKMDPALDRWEALERDRRPDMAALARFARDEPDPGMHGFAP